MAGEVGQAFIRVRPNTTGFQSEATSSLTRAVKGIALAVGGAFAAQKVFSFGSQAVETAASVQKSSEFIQSSFGRQSKALDEFAATAAKKFLISKDASEQFSATIGRLAQQNGIGAKTAAEMSMQLQELAGSFAEIRGTSPEPFLQALSRALIGNTRGLKQMGIAINSTNELQAAERLGFIQTTVDAGKVAEAHARVAEYTQKVADETKKYGASSTQALGATASLKGAQDQLSAALSGKANSTVTALTAAQKAQVIMAVATSHLSQLQQQAAQHSGDLADQQVRLTAEWSNAKAQIGEELLPQVTKLANVFATNLPAAMNKFDQVTKQVIQDVSPFVPPMVTAFTELFGVIRDNQQVVVDLAVAFVAYKVAARGVNEAISLGRDVVGIYTGLLQKLGLSQVQNAGETDVYTAAVQANTAALEAHTAVVTGSTAAADASVATNDVLGASLAALAAEMQAEAVAAEAASQSIGILFTESELLAGGADTLAASEAALAEALAAVTAASEASVVADTELAAAQTALAASAVESGGAMAAFGSGLIALAGGPIVVGAAAIAGIGFAMYKLSEGYVSPLDAQVNRLGGDFGRLAQAMHTARDARDSLKNALSAIPEEKMRVAEAQLNVEQARANLHNKDLNKSTLDRKRNELQLKEALQELRDAQKSLTKSERDAHKAENTLGDAAKARSKIIKSELFPALQGLISQDKEQIKSDAAAQKGIGRGITLQQREHGIRVANAPLVAKLVSQLHDQADSYAKSNPVLSHNITLLGQYAQHIGKLPDKKEINFILHIKRPKETLEDVVRQFAHGDAPKLGEDVSHNFATGMDTGLKKALPQLRASSKNAVNAMFAAAKAAGKISSPSVLFRDEVGVPVVQGIIAGIKDQDAPLQKEMAQLISDQIDPVNAETKTLGTAIWQGIVQPVQQNLAAQLGASIINAANSAISAARAKLQIHSPSLLFSSQIGQPLSEGILHGLGGLKAGLVSEIASAARHAAAVAGAVGGPVGSAAAGANQRLGLQMMLKAGWGQDQWGALQALWMRESGWNQFAKNASSGAYGIPQSLPANKMATAGADWMTNPATQIAWGLAYIRSRYGSPAGAWEHEGRFGWYDDGGIVPGPRGKAQIAVVHGGETILPTHKSQSPAGVNIEQLTVVTPSPNLWGQTSDVMNAIARKVRR